MASKLGEIKGSRTLLSIDKSTEDEKGRWVEIRVVEWVFENGTSRKLEKREFFRAMNGKEMTGKVQGLGPLDIEKIRPRLDEVVDLLGHSARGHAAKSHDHASAAAAGDDQEVPF
jgi:hypothetical protein